MINSVYIAPDKHSVVYKGTVSPICDCVAGYLLFFSKRDDISVLPSDATILVTECDDLSDILLSYANISNIVAAVVIGSSPKASALIEAERLSIPILTLDMLPKSHNGKIAILDTERAALFVDPDIDTVTKYSKAFSSTAERPLDLYTPISYTSFKTNNYENVNTPVGALHICSARTWGELRSEDELFDDYRELCENVRPLTLTLLLCPAYPMDEEASERFLTHTKAIFRAAVYGRIRILCGGPCSRTVTGTKKCLELISEAKESVRNTEKEHNPQIPIGALISSPIMLCSLNTLDNFDFLCLDLEKLPRSFFGIPAKAVLTDEAIYEFLEFLKVFLKQEGSVRPSCAILNDEIKKAIDLRSYSFSDIGELFVRPPESLSAFPHKN